MPLSTSTFNDEQTAPPPGARDQIKLTGLTPSGQLLLATDWEHYAQSMRTTLDAESNLENLAGAGNFAERNEERPTTRFEARGVRLGHEVWDLAYRRCNGVTRTR